MTLTEFLLARIAEDEAIAQAVRPEEHLSTRDHVQLGTVDSDGYTTCTITSGRVLAECTAKRRIVERHAVAVERTRLAKDRDFFAIDPIIRDLATAYADHPDYDPTWRL